MTSRMNAPKAEANKSIAEVVKTEVSLFGLRMYPCKLSKRRDRSNWRLTLAALTVIYV